MRKSAGFSLMEMMVVSLITIAVSGALFAVFMNTLTNNRVVQGINESDKGAREQLDTLVDHVRNAQQYRPDASTPYRVISAGTETSLTYYTDSAGSTVRYYLSGGALRRDATNAGGADTVVFENVTALEFKYYKATGSDYYTNTVPTTDVHAPAAEELRFLAQIDLTVTVSIQGQARQMFCQVRLRNSPYKSRL